MAIRSLSRVSIIQVSVDGISLVKLLWLALSLGTQCTIQVEDLQSLALVHSQPGMMEERAENTIRKTRTIEWRVPSFYFAQQGRARMVHTSEFYLVQPPTEINLPSEIGRFKGYYKGGNQTHNHKKNRRNRPLLQLLELGLILNISHISYLSSGGCIYATLQERTPSRHSLGLR